MPRGYVILTEAIKDQAGMDAYGRAATPAMISSGASVLAVDPQPQVLEGQWHGDRTVVLEFESVEAARAWYESAAYEKAKPLRIGRQLSRLAAIGFREVIYTPTGPDVARELRAFASAHRSRAAAGYRAPAVGCQELSDLRRSFLPPGQRAEPRRGGRRRRGRPRPGHRAVHRRSPRRLSGAQ